MNPLTARQREVLNLIRTTIRTKGYPPTVREIGANLGMNSPNAVTRHLSELERKGYVRRSGATRRTMTLVEVENHVRKTIPLLGKIS
jgi:repressor LexA